MAAELFSTSLPHGGEEEEEETKKNFIQLSEPEESERNEERSAARTNDQGENQEDGAERRSWQGAHPTLRERNALMFNNEHMADIHFIVGPPGETQTVPAHKYVLAVGSSVFGAMFYGDLAEGQSEIHIPDVEPAAFLTLLKYMYSDEVELDADTVLATLYAAKKYIVPAVAKACVGFLETSLEAKNACVLLSQSRLFEEAELTQRCWEVIDAQAELALRSEGFCEIDRPTLEIVLQRETLNIRENAVFQAALSWAAAECRRQGLVATPRNQRTVLGKALYLIRIPSMSLQEFADGPAQSDVLTLTETHNIFLWYTAANKPQLDFPVGKRVGLAAQRCHRFQASAYRSNQWRYRGRCDSIQFAVDRRIFMAGLGLYGSSGGKAEYSVRIELKRQGTLLAQNLTKFLSDGSSSTFPVWFEHPVQVEQDTFYTVSAVLDGNELSYFGQEGMTEVQCGKVTFQFQCSSDSTNGTGVQGGQIPELIFYC
ncbi:PREDICTED: BTB/POZ domain-containing protein 6-B-like [Cyprinodon variegatus]|uniref:BTB (POZ) domain containing 6b n=1 Tax=Cyprinodon variegatus TaxID=28743 RepID=A0A3Q2ECS0_CYPVA|nr:PREDICTED: BTB/POZ domain-containing protein 6-B-like [Cyprinodon variegatus]XP_015251157.1 PREDICTED: BTB/POZ domain-containing protein 6-B-like [Cyprinodon variegatus]XP_015251158.1 PREDICTED: BTB/POZ domain-containing protein 6-B-like [Cyprinodon variegatus]XP_015251159.1 PREDICTED: BTB/POZ domain-containing protein 6-B-like [Cyprinodon variegatus]